MAKDQKVMRPRLLRQKYPDTEVGQRLRLPGGHMLQAQDRHTATTESFFAACLSFFGFETRPIKVNRNKEKLAILFKVCFFLHMLHFSFYHICYIFTFCAQLEFLLQLFLLNLFL